MTSETLSPLRLLPSVDALLHAVKADKAFDDFSHAHLTTRAREVVGAMREELRGEAGISHQLADLHPSEDTDNADKSLEAGRLFLLEEACRRLRDATQDFSANAVRRVINATGVVLHTNLGRAPLAAAARERLAREAALYCTLEYDLTTGERGRRGGRVENLLCQLTGAEAAFVVNNCAAATLLVLAALTREGETIISRGELVEIGGDFRIPDVMRESRTVMIEVGTTNRTHIEDYERAITDKTQLIARVHPSNYRIVGFTHAPALSELAALCRTRGITLYEDAGSGALTDLSVYGLHDEPVIPHSIAAGCDVVSFSGDKLLGASQAGIIVGREALIDRIRRTPLARALRLDKLSLVALEATLEIHARGNATRDIPALRMIAATQAEIKTRAEAFIRNFQTHSASHITLEIIEGVSAIGGGSAPTTHPPTALIAISHTELSPANLAAQLRANTTPIITRIIENRVVLDFRTVEADEETEIHHALCLL
ncbi:MAG: L-seryl-tRNA(Sec) selenium transferase [Pyrinomonadaceae bacterium MAG19_C2-C3]|nr:L-seryl-tRNA(Sec) selenium transferase [Pyrinomonadaceae bacterium MAG19_C2-C3]